MNQVLNKAIVYGYANRLTGTPEQDFRGASTVNVGMVVIQGRMELKAALWKLCSQKRTITSTLYIYTDGRWGITVNPRKDRTVFAVMTLGYVKGLRTRKQFYEDMTQFFMTIEKRSNDGRVKNRT